MRYLLLMLLPTTASFPEIVQKERRLDKTPDCAICHAGGVTGAGTVTTDYGKALVAAGLEPYDEVSLLDALHVVDRDPPSLEELDQIVPEYGCHAVYASDAALLCLVVWLTTRRGSYRRRSR